MGQVNNKDKRLNKRLIYGTIIKGWVEGVIIKTLFKLITSLNFSHSYGEIVLIIVTSFLVVTFSFIDEL